MNIHSGLIDTVISNLKFIGKIQVGDKINIHDKSIYKNLTWFDTLLRQFYYGDSRQHALFFIQDTINNALEILDYRNLGKEPENIEFCKNLINDLKNALKGLENIRETYIDDIKFGCDIDTIHERIVSKMKQV